MNSWVPLDSANANHYAYAANDPINNSDPLEFYNFEDSPGTVVDTYTAGFGGAGLLIGCAVGGFQPAKEVPRQSPRGILRYF